MKKKLGFMKLFTIALITPPVNLSALFGLYYAVCGFDFMFSTYDGIDGFAAGSILWFVIIYVCKLGLLALVGIIYGIAKLFRFLVNFFDKSITATMPR